jgi:hypothetical protein
MPGEQSRNDVLALDIFDGAIEDTVLSSPSCAGEGIPTPHPLHAMPPRWFQWRSLKFKKSYSVRSFVHGRSSQITAVQNIC